jgi:hypothetical protein
MLPKLQLEDISVPIERPGKPIIPKVPVYFSRITGYGDLEARSISSDGNELSLAPETSVSKIGSGTRVLPAIFAR